jgi:hypothetical protein
VEWVIRNAAAAAGVGAWGRTVIYAPCGPGLLFPRSFGRALSGHLPNCLLLRHASRQEAARQPNLAASLYMMPMNVITVNG